MRERPDMDGRERTRRAIRFESPDRTPLWMFNRDQPEGDVLIYGYGLNREDGTAGEWGFTWRNLGDGTMGQPEEPVIATWDDLATFRFPSRRAEERLAHAAEFQERAQGYYRLGAVGITGFNNYTFLRGFENALVDFLAEPERAFALFDRMLDWEGEMIDIAAEAGLDGFHFCDDWGMQEGLVIAPSLWRELFKPRYGRLVERAHRHGLDVWFHSCGDISDIVRDFHEIGVDVINISQPNVVDLEPIAADLAGKQCFMVPISYQTVSISGTPEDIQREADRLRRLFERPEGGFIAYVEEYSCMGMSEENYQACKRAFRSPGPLAPARS